MRTYLSMLMSTICTLLCCADYDLLETGEAESVQLQISGVSANSVTLRWSQYEKSNFAKYSVYYGYGENDIIDINDTLADTLTYARDTQKTIWNLEPSTLYHFRVIVHTTGGETAPSAVVDTTTLPDPYRRIFVKADSISDTSAIVSWSDSRSGKRYRVFWRDTSYDVDSGSTAGMTAVEVHDDSTETITTLRSSTTYELSVSALNEYGEAILGSDTVLITTRRPEPDSVTIDIDEASLTDSSAVLRWTQNHNHDFMHYVVRRGTAPFDSLFDRDAGAVFDTLDTLTGLDDSTTYYARVFVVDSLGYWSASNLDSFTTLATVPDSVTLTLQNVTDSSVALAWDKTTLDTSDFGSYQIHWSTDPNVDTGSSRRKSIFSPETTSDTLKIDTLAQYYITLFLYTNAGRFVGSNEVVNYPVWLYDGAFISDSIVQLTWKKYIGEALQRYVVYRDTVSGVTNTKGILIPDPLRYEEGEQPMARRLDTLHSGGEYYYRVFVDVEGEQLKGSNEVKVEYRPELDSPQE
ncbi:MAG: hypothetical protein GF344_01965 [Chitinivibrionales bacterium]|nr:hypothetical protein [Chitinivibrionales bacterium]MBD3355861.1 hypothetical protein [Chitinivibrionales bacterium]